MTQLLYNALLSLTYCDDWERAKLAHAAWIDLFVEYHGQGAIPACGREAYINGYLP